VNLKGELPAAKRAAVFLDRDGTLNEEKAYLHRVEDFAFIPGAVEAVKALREAGFLVIVVTNQSGVARGYYSEGDVAALHRHIQGELARHATRIDAFYSCPHHPTQGKGRYRQVCDCRKGAPGMLLRAAVEHRIDLAQSYMVGDKVADMEAGERAGCTPILVMTGYGAAERERMAQGRARVCADLGAAARLILDQTRANGSDAATR
jgi:D-glycero-D-manno-heptose 1,7-bisphosphate phosphatase